MIDVLTVVITGLTSQKRESEREERGRERVLKAKRGAILVEEMRKRCSQILNKEKT